MNYIKLIDTLFSFAKRGCTTFEAFRRFDQALKSPHRSFRSVHVAGTNGKGSVATKIAEGLKLDGFRVGLYTSPHISSVRERICVNGEMISEESVCSLLPPILREVTEQLSFFDLLTALAFTHFQQSKVDWAVIEVGLGGRLDPTNVIFPQLSVITSIGYDHMAILGSTLEEIAKEKGGIVKTGVPLIVGPTAAPFFPDAQMVAAPTVPFYDAENSLIAQEALHHLNVSKAVIAKAILIRPPCRFEQVGDVILDVAHNVDGFRKLIEALQFHFPNETFHFIVGFSQDKESEKCLALIRPIAANITLVPIGAMAIEHALTRSPLKTVICGSFYLMEEARASLQ